MSHNRSHPSRTAGTTGGGTPRPTTSRARSAPYSGFGLGPPMMPSAEDTAQAIQWQERIVYYGGGGSLRPRQNFTATKSASLLIGLVALIIVLK